MKQFFKKIAAWFKSIEWNKRIGNGDKGTEDYVKPVVSWSLIGGESIVCILLAIILI